MDSNENKQLEMQAKEVEDVRVPDTKDTIEQKDSTTFSFADTLLTAMVKPTATAPLADEETEWAKVKDTYTDRFGNKAKDEFSKVYNVMAKEYERIAEKELNKVQVLRSMDYIVKGEEDRVTFIDEDYVPTIDVNLETNSGRQQVLDTWTDPTRSVRTAAIEDKAFIDWEGNKVDVPNGLYDGITRNSNYANKEGKEIYGFEYAGVDELDRGTATVKALYEGDDPTGEVVSRWDSNSLFKGNDLNMAIWKVPFATSINFAADIADTVLALGENLMVLGTLGGAKDSDVYEWIRDSRNSLKSFNVAKSDKDQQSLFTVNNMLEMGIYTGLQLLSGRGMATAFGSLYGASTKAAKQLQGIYKKIDATTDVAERAALVRKAATMTKRMESAGNLAGKSTLFMLGAMAAKDASDEARKAGFNELESAAIYATSLGGMMWVNQLSELGFEKLGINKMRKITSETAESVFKGVTPSSIMSSKNRFSGLIKEHGNKIISKYKSATAGKGYGSYMISEAAEEEAELLMQEVINHTATAAAALGYDKDERPAFKTVFDEGYWESFATESLMSIMGGAMGGAMNRGFFAPRSEIKAVKESELPISGKEADAMKKIAYMSNKSSEGQAYEVELLKKMSELKESGYMGRADISTKYDKKAGRYKLVSELTEADKNKYTSQSDMMYKSALAQYMYYKQVFALESGTFNEIVKDNKEFGYLAQSNELQTATMKSIEERAEILSKVNVPIDLMTSEVSKLSNVRKGIKPVENADGEETVDTSTYDEKVATLAGTSGLSVQEINKLVDINDSIKAISTGEVLESAFINLQLTKEAYNKEGLFKDKSRFDRLVNADLDMIKYGEKTLEEALETQKEFDSQFAEAIKTGELSDELKAALIAGDVKLSPKVKEKVKPLIENLGVPLEDKKRIAMQKILSDAIALTNKPGNKNLLNTIDEDYNVVESDFVSRLSEAIVNDPSSVPSLIETFRTEAEYSGGYVKGDSDENQDDSVKVSYMMSKLVNIANTDTDAGLMNIQYSPEQIDIAGAHRADVEETSVFTDLRIGDPVGVGTLGDIMPSDSMSEEKAGLLSSLDGVRSFEKGMVLNVFDKVINESNPNKTVTTNLTLDSLYQTLISSATLDSNGEPTTFSNLQAAKELLNKIDVKLAQSRFVLENASAMNQIQEINKKYFNPDESSMMNFTKLLGLVPAIEMASDSFKNLNDLKTRTERLVELAKNASEDLFKAFTGDAVSYASNQLKTISSFLDRDATKPLLEKRTRLEGLFEVVNGADHTSTSTSNLEELFTRLYKAREILTDEVAKNDGFTEELISTRLTQYADDEKLRDILILSLSPSDYMFGRMRETYKELTNAAKTDGTERNLILPTMKQIRMVEEAVVAATTNFLPLSQRLVSSASTQKPLPIAVFNGRQGTGKTHVVAVEAAKMIQEIIAMSEGVVQGVMFASNSVEQARKLRKAADVKTSGIDSELDVTQDLLWETLVNSDLTTDQLASMLEDTGVIIYDEISHVEFLSSKSDIDAGFSDPKNAGVLNGILGKLYEVNKLRVDKGQLPITLLGIGDTKQGGFIEGSSSPRNKTGDERLKGGVHSVYASEARPSIYRSANELTYQFRYQVLDIGKGAKDVIRNLADSKNILSDGTIKPTEFIYSKEGFDYTGIEKSDSWEKVYNNTELVDSMREGLKTDSEFDVLIISGSKEYDGSVPADSPLGKFLHEFKDDDRVRTKPFYKVQGDEATYALVNVPNDHLIYTKEQVEAGLETAEIVAYRNRVNDVAMSIGRAKRYTNIVIKGDWKITSEKGSTTIRSDEELTSFKADWGKTLVNDILKNYDTIPSSVTTHSSIKPEKVITIETEGESTEDVLNEQEIKIGMLVTLPTGEKGIIEELVNGTAVISTLDTGETLDTVSIQDIMSGKVMLDISAAKINKGGVTQKTFTPTQLTIPFKDTGVEIQADEVTVVNPQTSEEANSKILKSLGLNSTDTDEVLKAKKVLTDKRAAKDTTVREKEDIDAAITIIDNLDNVIQNNPSWPDFVDFGNVNESDQEVMINIERTEGNVVFFGHMGEDVSYAKSLESKSTYSWHLYGTDSFDRASYAEEFTNAMGLGPKGIKGRDDYKYHLVSYEMKFRGDIGYNHVIVAERAGKKLIIGSLGKRDMYKPDPIKDGDKSLRGDLYYWMEQREKALESVVKEYLTTDGKSYPKSTTNTDKVIYSTPKDSLLPPTSVEGKVRSATSLDKRFAITSEFLAPGLLFNGITVGNVNNQGNAVKEVAMKIQEVVDIIPDISKLHAVETRKSKLSYTVVKDSILKHKVRGKFNKMSDILESKESIPFDIVEVDGEKKVFRKVDDHTYINIKTPRGVFTFFLDNKSWIPAIGYDSIKKAPILDTTMLDTNSDGYEAEIESISKALNGLYVSDKHTMSIKGSVVEAGIASIIGYDVEDMAELETTDAKIGLARKSLDKKLNMFLGNTRLPLNVAKKLWAATGKPYSVSEPFVIMRHSNDELVGKSVVFYSYDTTKKLNSMTESELLTEYLEMTKAQNNSSTKMTTNRNGIGYIILDSEPQTISSLDEMFMGMDQKSITKDMNKVVMHGKTGDRMMSMLAALHIELNNPSKTDRVYKLVNELDPSLSKDTIRAWGKNNKQLKTYLGEFLQVIFEDSALGALAMADVDEDIKALSDEVYKVRQDPEALKELYEEEIKLPGMKDKLNMYGITESNLVDLMVIGGAGSNGRIAVNAAGSPKIISNQNSVISYADPDLIARLGDTITAPKPTINLNSLLSILNRDSMSQVKSDLITALDSLVPLTKGLSRGLFVSPMTTDNSNPISKAHKSTGQDLGDTLTTSVKQFKVPSIVFNVQSGLQPTKFKKVAEMAPKQVATIKPSTDSFADSFNNAKTKAALNRIYSRLSSTVSEEDRVKLDEAYKKATDKFKGTVPTPVKLDFRTSTASEFIGETGNTEIDSTIKAFDNLSKVIRNKQEFEEYWVAGIKDVLGDNIPTKLNQYINAVIKSEFIELSDNELWVNALELMNSGENLPILDPEVDKSMVSNWKTKKNTMGNRLDTLLLWNNSTGTTKAKYAKILNTNPNSEEDIAKRAAMDQEVISTTLSVQDLDKRLNLLNQHFSDIKDNYYNDIKRMNAMSSLRTGIDSIPDGYEGKSKLLENVDNFIKTELLSGLMTTSYGSIVDELAENTNYIENTTQEFRDNFNKDVLPILGNMPNIHYLWTYINDAPSIPSMEQLKSIMEYTTLLRSIPGISEVDVSEYEKVIDKLVGCK